MVQTSTKYPVNIYGSERDLSNKTTKLIKDLIYSKGIFESVFLHLMGMGEEILSGIYDFDLLTLVKIETLFNIKILNININQID